MSTDHWLSLPDAATINTRPFALTQRALGDMVDHQMLGAFYGDAGLGKTFAVAHAASHQTSARRLWITAGVKPTMKQLIRAVLREVTDMDHQGERFTLRQTLIDLLAEDRFLLVVDEAQRLNLECIETLRDLHEQAPFALAFVGGNGCYEELRKYPMLRSRTQRWIAFTPMDLPQVLNVLPRFHPILAQASPDVLALVDDAFAHGNWRAWASFTHAAAGLCREHCRDQVDETIARNAIALIAGGHPAS